MTVYNVFPFLSFTLHCMCVCVCVCMCMCVSVWGGWGLRGQWGLVRMCVLGNGSWRSDKKAQKVSVLLLSRIPDNREHTNYVLQLLREQNIHN